MEHNVALKRNQSTRIQGGTSQATLVVYLIMVGHRQILLNAESSKLVNTTNIRF